MSQPSTPLFQRYGDLAPDLDLPAGEDRGVVELPRLPPGIGPGSAVPLAFR